MNGSTLDINKTLQRNVPLTNSRATTNHLFNVLVDSVALSTMTHKLLRRQTRAGYENLLRVEPAMAALNLSAKRVTVNQTQKPIESAAFFAEVIEDDVSLISITVEPNQLVTRNPRHIF